MPHCSHTPAVTGEALRLCACAAGRQHPGMAAHVRDIFGESDEEEETVAPLAGAPGDVLADADLDEPLVQVQPEGVSPREREEEDIYQHTQMLVERPTGPPLEIEVPFMEPLGACWARPHTPLSLSSLLWFRLPCASGQCAFPLEATRAPLVIACQMGTCAAALTLKLLMCLLLSIVPLLRLPSAKRSCKCKSRRPL